MHSDALSCSDDDGAGRLNAAAIRYSTCMGSSLSSSWQNGALYNAQYPGTAYHQSQQETLGCILAAGRLRPRFWG